MSGGVFAWEFKRVASALGLRVLMIEGDLDLLQAMSAEFEAAGYTVSAAGDGDEGIWLFGRGGHDLVITDVVLPGRDGLEVIAAIRRLRPRTKVIAISGSFRSGPEEYLKVARYVGADATLAKPFALEALIALARRSLCSA